jgi:hypothetical protein
LTNTIVLVIASIETEAITGPAKAGTVELTFDVMVRSYYRLNAFVRATQLELFTQHQ